MIYALWKQTHKTLSRLREPYSQSFLVQQHSKGNFPPFNKLSCFCLTRCAYKSERLRGALRVSGSVPIRFENWLWLHQLPCAFHFWAVGPTTAFRKSNRKYSAKASFHAHSSMRGAETIPELETKLVTRNEEKSLLSSSSVFSKEELLKRCWE